MNKWLKIGDDRIDLSKVIYVRHDRREKLVLVVQDGSDGSIWVKGDEASAEFLTAFDAYHGIGQPDAVDWYGRSVTFKHAPKSWVLVWDQKTTDDGELQILVDVDSRSIDERIWRPVSEVAHWEPKTEHFPAKPQSVNWIGRRVQFRGDNTMYTVLDQMWLEKTMQLKVDDGQWVKASQVIRWQPADEPAPDDKDAEIARLRKENERLLVTLKPFAELYDGYSGDEVEAFPDFYDYVDSVIRGDDMVSDFLYASVEYKRSLP